jgi:excisionase family DNA binding protein
MSTTEQRPELLTVRELAGYLRVTTRTAYQLIHDNKVPSVRIGGSIRIPREALIRSLTKTTEPSP